MGFDVIRGDCVEAMAAMEDGSVDAIVTDPPYGLELMGEEWDKLDGPAGAVVLDPATERGGFQDGSGGNPYSRSRIEYGRDPAKQQEWHLAWATQALRVLKPGGHLLAFGGTRTYHRLTCAVEDAGFEIRDSVLWLYGSGFPKSFDVSKAIDKAAGAQREVVGEADRRSRFDGAARESSGANPGWREMEGRTDPAAEASQPITLPATPEATQWEGWGTALKPGHEPIVVARKPPVGSVAANVLEHGTGAINVDGCRVGMSAEDREVVDRRSGRDAGGESHMGWATRPDGERFTAPAGGRWPANVVLTHVDECEPVGVVTLKGDPRDTGGGECPGGFADVGADSGAGEPNAPVYGDEDVVEWRCAPGCPVAALNAQSGEQKSGTAVNRNRVPGTMSSWLGTRASQTGEDFGYDDSGGAARFFYCAKTSAAERSVGLRGFEEKVAGGMSARQDGSLDGGVVTARNHHPTVKPIALMRWLCRLVTPPGGLILDPFLGSGSTGCAAVLEGFAFVGIEREAEYATIAFGRVSWWEQHRGREAEEVLAAAMRSERRVAEHEDSGQLGLEIVGDGSTT